MHVPKKQEKLRIAMIMAAGYGTRMGSLTRDLPKPLLPLNDLRIIEVALFKLARQGFERVVINLHCFADKMQQILGDGRRYGIEIIFSHEPELLGSGGGIAKAEGHFAGETILVLNADVLSDLSIPAMFDHHRESGVLSTMCVLPSQNNKDYTLVKYTAQNRLAGFMDFGEALPANYHTGIFMGYHILSPAARAYLRPEFQSVINRFYKKALAEGEPIGIYPFSGTWIDVGTAAFYRQFVREIRHGKIDLQKFM